jgi:hypothetical protein
VSSPTPTISRVKLKRIIGALVKEANLAFSLNTHLFSLIRPSTSQEVTITTSQTTTLLAPQDPHGTSHLITRPEHVGLRYYEIRALEQARQLRENPPKPNTWPERIERFFIFAGMALAGWFISRFVAPAAMPYLEEGVERGMNVLQAMRKGRGGYITPEILRAGFGQRRGGYVGDMRGGEL